MYDLVYNRTADAVMLAADLNRVEDWTQRLSASIRAAGYALPKPVCKVNWTYTDTVKLGDLNRIRHNVEALEGSFAQIPAWRPVQFSDGFDYTQADALEWDLAQCKLWLDRMQAFPIYSGEIFCGEVI